ncbi:AAA family ATPase [Bradyrhizobium sp. UFLA01-814]|uniref:NACHT and WD repeat domain-containing protein n=1 Tax=Bradyrhizobium sp. UFLA01-814 TaxID=3023480 RepID=UPI00398BA93E
MEPGDISSLEPYPGLRPFRKDESDIFFGRDDHISEMIVKLSKSHFLCVTGSSGCGKSSLARTGLMNHLEAGFLPGEGSDWIFCDLHPGDHPLDNLFGGIADAIVSEVQKDAEGRADERSVQIREFLKDHVITQRRTSDLNTVLDLVAGIGTRPIMILVDQFEELFRYAQSDSEAAVNLVEILLKTAAAKGKIYIVITIRTDELEKCSRYPGLAHLINDSQFLTPVLDRYQIQQAIEGPITLWGGQILPDLSTWLLNCLEDELDRLPLMQHALRRLYAAKTLAENRKDVTIGLEDFVRVFELPEKLDLMSAEGRLALRHTLSDRLTQRYDTLPEHLKPAARLAFCALTTVDSRNRDIRQPQKLGTLAKIIGASDDDTRSIVRAFVTRDEAYLRYDPLLAKEDTVDVTHECILRLWQPLQAEWMADEKRSGENIASLARLARDWSSTPDSRSAFERLFAGIGLKWVARGQYQSWFDKTRPSSEWAARYLGNVDWSGPPESGTRRATPEAIFKSIVALLDASKRQQWLFVVTSIVVALGLLAGVSLVSFQMVSANAREKERVAQEKQRVEDEQEIWSLPLEHTRIYQVKSALKAFNLGLANFGAVWSKLPQVYELYRFGAGDEVHAADFAADGNSVLAIDKSGILHQWAVTPGRDVLREVDFGLPDPERNRAQGRSLIVSPRGDVAAIGFNQGSVVLLDLTGTENRFKALQIDGHNPHGIDSVFKVVFSFDGTLLVTSSRAGNIAIWERSSSSAAQPGASQAQDPLSWTLKQDVDLKKQLSAADIWAVDIDRAKQTIAVGLGDGRICFLPVDDPSRSICPEESTKRRVKSVKFLPNGSTLVSAGNDAKVTIWEFDASTRTAKPSPFALEHNNAIWDVDVSRDGSLLATGDFYGSVRVYQTGTWRLLNVIAADALASRQSPRPVGAEDTAVDFYPLRTVRFNPASTMLVTSSLDRTARVWTPLIDRASIRELSFRLPPAEDKRPRRVFSVALNPSGEEVVFTDKADVYVKAAGKMPQPLPTEGKPKYDQVLVRTANEIVVSAVEPLLTVWNRQGDGGWVVRTVALPGDPILVGRALAIGASGTLLAVEVRNGKTASVLLCPLRGAQWSCSASENPDVVTLPLNGKIPSEAPDDDCTSNESEVHIALSGSGRLVAAGAGKCPIQLFDLRNRNQFRSYGGHKGEVNSLDFAPDETALVASSQAGEVKIWDVASKDSKNVSHHASPYVTAAKFSPSGKSIVSTSDDNSVIVSDARSGAQIAKLTYRNSLFGLAVAKTMRGTLMATGSEAGDVNVGTFFEDGNAVTSYARSVLHDVSP